MNEKIDSATIDESEIRKFTAMADEWWDKKGKFKPLHKFNPVRVSYIQNAIEQHFTPKNDGDLPLKGITILDVGCGGGLICEPLAALGAEVTGIDAGEKNIKIATVHAKQSGVKVNYRHISVEALEEEGKQYDVVLNLEVLEHVADVDSFLQSSAALIKPDGLMFMATLNRTAKSYALGIVGAEYILRWLPRGTHDWHKFLKPSEINRALSDTGVKLQELKGVSYNPITDVWSLTNDTSVNYMMQAVKAKQA